MAKKNDDTFIGTPGADTYSGGNGNDQIFGRPDGFDDQGDTFSGDNGNDIIQGNQGNDVISGGNGSDRLSGNLDNDTIDGGNGKDVINGGGGDDLLTGGSGKDTFVFGTTATQNLGNDTVTDFHNDIVDLSLLVGLWGADFDEFSDLVIYDDVDGNAVIDINASDSSATVFGTITLLGVSSSQLSDSDFLFV